MYKIKKIILWPYDSSKNKREIELDLDKINVIHGESRTGKTALISCIDFALCSSNCKIPVGKILECVKWFGVLLKSEDEEILIARLSTNEKKVESRIYLDYGRFVRIPESIKKGNNNLLNTKEFINEKMNYYNEKIEVDETSGYIAKPSFRDSVSFNFQPQTIIASPDILYYKTNLTEYRERLIKEFYYFLGVINNDILITQILKRNLEKERKRLKKQIENNEQTRTKIINDLTVLYANALDLGIVENSVPLDDEKSIINELNRVVKSKNYYANYNENLIEKVDKKIMQLEMQREELRIKILKYKKFIYKAQQSINSANKVNVDENYQNRIGILKWLTEQLIQNENIISQFLNENIEYENVVESIMKYENIIAKNKNAILNLEEEKSRIKIKLSAAINDYNNLNKQLQVLYENNKKAREVQLLEQNKFLFIGELKSIMEKYNSDEIVDLKERLHTIDAELSIINNKIDKKIIEQKFMKISQTISDDTLKLLKTLDVDDKYSPVYIEIDDLTISRASDQFGESKDYLYQIGSASNWLSYHIAFLLALHKHFVSLKPQRVMNFIVLDQPSQVYFPDGNIGENTNRELEKVKCIFKTLSLFNKSVKDVQIIVLEHAGKNVWGQYSNIKEIENWNNGLKLIPKNWKKREDL